MALLDTGATNSGLTPRIIDQLGLESYGKRPLGSARGEEQTPRYFFRIGFQPANEGDVPQFPFIFEEVDGFELRNSFQFDALIGMDVLRHCDFIMRRNGQWSLSFGS